MLAEGIGKGSGTPQEHPTVPEIIPRGHKRRGLFRVRLFGESAHVECFAFEETARLNVSVAGFGPIGSNAENHNVLTLSGDLDSTFDGRAIVVLIPDHVIRRKHANHGVGIFAKKKKGSETDCGSGVPS